MKLVEILARELKEWPTNMFCIHQDADKQLGYSEIGDRMEYSRSQWDHKGDTRSTRGIYINSLAADHATAIVTREMWEAEKARIAKPAKKADKDGWIRHRGGKCPVDGHVAVQVVMRSETKQDFYDEVSPAAFWEWSHSKSPSDVMWYRLHTPAIEPEVVENVGSDHAPRELHKHAQPTEPEATRIPIQIDMEHAVKQDGPLQWRDRIREIDTTVEALEEERVSLIQRLADEGLKLLRVDAKAFPKAAIFDPADQETWRTGDFVEIAGSDNISWKDRAGMVGALRYDEGIYRGGWYIKFDSARDWFVSDNTTLKFHSRPST